MHALPVTSGTLPAAPTQDLEATKLRELAVEFEAVFLAQMLKSAGLGETTSAFSGGAGEAQFASFLRDAQAREMARAGGLGLSEQIFQLLQESTHDH